MSNSVQYYAEKRLHNLRRVFESGLIEHVKKTYGNPPLLLFGSYLRGEDLEESDVDLFIQTSQKIDLRKFEKKLGRSIQIFAYTSLKKIENSHLANNIVNGLTLNSYVEVFE